MSQYVDTTLSRKTHLPKSGKTLYQEYPSESVQLKIIMITRSPCNKSNTIHPPRMAA